MPQIDGQMPDFIIIGAMKSATSTLQEQLASQAGIFMSDPKEPNFFSDENEFARGMDWYRGLFAEAKESEILGEASTHYTKLPTYPETVARLKTYLPDVRLIYVMRHPIDRLVSHYIHEWSMGKIRCSINEALERYPELVAYGQYITQLEPYFGAYGQAAVLPVFFDRLVSQPQPELERVCRFIGYPGRATWRDDLGPSNTSSERIRRFPLYHVLIESGFATGLRRTLIPQSLRDAIKRRLRMQERPELSPLIRAELEAVFDQDLARLGEFLGKPLSCENFKQVTSDSELNWVVRND